jgi:hypothetical protein
MEPGIQVSALFNKLAFRSGDSDALKKKEEKLLAGEQV